MNKNIIENLIKNREIRKKELREKDNGFYFNYNHKIYPFKEVGVYKGRLIIPH